MRHVICFGNTLHGDDGFGPEVYQRLAALLLPPDVRVFDAGTRGLDALGLFEGCQEAIIVDALEPGSQPGQVTRHAPEAFAPEPSMTGHGAGVAYLLAALAALGGPPLQLVVAEAASLRSFSIGLSERMQHAVHETVQIVCAELGIEHG